MYPTLIRQSDATAARRRVPIWLVDATDGIAAETGVTGNVRISKNGAASATTTNTIVEVDATNMPGLYTIELTTTEVDTLGHVLLAFKTAATAQWHGFAHIIDVDLYDTVRMGLTALPNVVAEGAGGLYTRGTGAGQINQDANGRIDANVAAMAAAVLTAAAIAADAINNTKIAAGAITSSEAPNLDAAITTRATPAQVNTEVLDVLNVDTFAEPPQELPPSTTTLVKKIGYLFKFKRNRITVTTSQINVFNDDATTVGHKSTHSDDATTYDRGEFESGP